MTAVAVWDHEPSPKELLKTRRAAGWEPTPSALQGGDRVLGYAACLFQTDEMKALEARPAGPSSHGRDESPGGATD